MRFIKGRRLLFFIAFALAASAGGRIAFGAQVTADEFFKLIYGDAAGEVKRAIRNGTDVNMVHEVDSVPTTPLLHAIKFPRHEIARILIARGADVEQKGNMDVTPLVYAIMQASFDRLKATGMVTNPWISSICSS